MGNKGLALPRDTLPTACSLNALMLSQGPSTGAKGMEDTQVPFCGCVPSPEGQGVTYLLPRGSGKAGPRPLEPGNSTELSYLMNSYRKGFPEWSRWGRFTEARQTVRGLQSGSGRTLRATGLPGIGPNGNRAPLGGLQLGPVTVSV